MLILFMQQRPVVPAQQRQRLESQNIGDGIAAESETSVDIHLPDPVLGGFDGRPQLLLAASQLELRAPSCGLECRLAHGPFDRGHQARKIGLEHIVGGTAPQCIDGAFLADRSRYEQERGLGCFLAGDGQCAQAVELRQRKIGHDDVGLDVAQRGAKGRLCLNAMHTHVQSPARQMPAQQFGVSVNVLDQDQSKSGFHSWNSSPAAPWGWPPVTASSSLIYLEAPAPGIFARSNFAPGACPWWPFRWHPGLR
ncbi:MAG: hypothetical protein WB646_16795 [Steroidobacteraceae bacterium]